MKKPVQRVILLEDVLSDILEVEDLLLQLELKDALQPLSSKQIKLYKEIMQRVHELVRDVTMDVARDTAQPDWSARL